MFAYPPATALHRVVPKTKIYAHVTASKRLKALFAAQVAELMWAHKLSPETLHLPARDGIQEIQVFSLALKTPELDSRILQLIDTAIPFPLFFELVYGNTVRFAATFKRRNSSDPKKWVIEAEFQTEPRLVGSPRSPLPVAVDLAGLYEHLLRPHIPLKARAGESLRDLISRHSAAVAKREQLPRLEAQLAREKQFNRKVELNSAVRQLRVDLEQLLA